MTVNVHLRENTRRIITLHDPEETRLYISGIDHSTRQKVKIPWTSIHYVVSR